MVDADVAAVSGIARDAAVRTLKAGDPKLGALIDAVGPCRLSIDTMQSPYEALFEAIVYQQLTGKAAATIFGRVRASFPGRRFPRPADVLATDDAVLRAAGLSGPKIRAVRDLSEKAATRRVPSLARLQAMSDDEVVDALTPIKGIGRWTVEMLLIFRLGRPDVLPVADLGIRKGFAVTYRTRGLPAPERVAAHGERWRPHRTIASWYLWRAAERARGA
ncbi:MAG: DNA-3-methyladenine glycosylase 2 family protein [Acidobacteriota bacterium]